MQNDYEKNDYDFHYQKMIMITLKI